MKISNKSKSPVYSIDSGIPGPRVVIIAEELNAIEVNKRIIEELQSEQKKIAKGQLTVVVNNAKEKINNVDYEKIAQEADYILIFQPTLIATSQFLVCPRHLLYHAMFFGFKNIVTGIEDFSESHHHSISNTATFSVLIGNNNNNNNTETSEDVYNNIISFLVYHKMLEEKYIYQHHASVYEIYDVQKKESDNTRFAKPFQNFTTIKKGEPVLEVDSQIMYADSDFSLIIASNHDKAGLGDEIYFKATKKFG